MNSEFKNEILMDGFLVSKDLENKKFQIKNNDDIIEFRYDENFKESDKGGRSSVIRGYGFFLCGVRIERKHYQCGYVCAGACACGKHRRKIRLYQR